MDAREYRLQDEGLAAALVAPEVREAFLAEPGELVALQIYEWSGWQQQVVRQDWVVIAREADLDGGGGAARAQERSYAQYPTAIGFALLFGAAAAGRAARTARERTLDVSGDGDQQRRGVAGGGAARLPAGGDHRQRAGDRGEPRDAARATTRSS